MNSSKRPSGKVSESQIKEHCKSLSKDNCKVEEYRGKYRLSIKREFSRMHFGVEQKRPATGLSILDASGRIDKANADAVTKKVVDIHNDLAHGSFDKTLVKYGLAELTVIDGGRKPELSLLELWEKYCEYKKPNLAATTYINRYQGEFLSIIQSIPSQAINALEIRQHIIQARSNSGAKRLIAAIDGCYQWALKNKLVPENPFSGMAKEIKVARNTRKLPISIQGLEIGCETSDYRAFTKEERDAIIAEFERSGYKRHWASLIKFLFWTGCRPGEAIALRWKHISPDFSKIHFCEAYAKIFASQKAGVSGVFKPTKTNKPRYFKTGERLQNLLMSIKPEEPNPEDLVFTTKKGKIINWASLTRIWQGRSDTRQPGLIAKLIQEKKVSIYLSPYATRHTYVTLMLNEGINAIDIAKQVGNSAEIILKHYASATRDLTLPEV